MFFWCWWCGFIIYTNKQMPLLIVKCLQLRNIYLFPTALSTQINSRKCLRLRAPVSLGADGRHYYLWLFILIRVKFFYQGSRYDVIKDFNSPRCICGTKNVRKECEPLPPYGRRLAAGVRFTTHACCRGHSVLVFI